MGKVRMSEFHRIAGVYEPVESIVDYTYCDECGSFNLEYLVPLHTKVLTAVEVLVVAALLATIYLHNWTLCGAASLMGGLIAFLMTRGISLRCRKCGNKHITDANVLHYPSDAMSIDVPDGCIIKRHIKTVIY